MKGLLPLAKAIRCFLKMRVDTKDNTDQCVERRAIDRCLLRKRLQLERNARALAETQSRFLQGSPKPGPKLAIDNTQGRS